MDRCGVTVTASNDIPMDDGRIAHALEAVEQRLDAFIHALRDMQVQAAPPSPRITAESKQVNKSIDAEVPSPPGVKDEARIRQPDGPAPVQEETFTPDSGSINAKSVHETEEKAENTGTTTPHCRDQSTDVKLRSSKRNESQRVSNISSNDEESLLNSLDEETASAIRVMRRLSMGTKTVRELLDEYNTMRKDDRPDHSDNRPRKSWFWKRGQEDE